MNKIYDGVTKIDCKIGDNIVIGEGTFLRKSCLEDYVQINRRNILENVNVGKYTYTGSNTILKHVDIGRYCAISWNVSATGNIHDYGKTTVHPFTYLKSFGYVESDVQLEHENITIGNDVWIGANVCIMAGKSIGDGAVIGAGTVVTKDVPPYSIVVGNPGKVIKKRFDEKVIELLLQAKWWDFSHEIISENLDCFTREMNLVVAEKLVELSERARQQDNCR